jgi:hypothetical protein
MDTYGASPGPEQHVVGAQQGVWQGEQHAARIRQNGRRMQQRRSQQQQPADSRVTAKAIVAIIRRKRMEGIPSLLGGRLVSRLTSLR